MTKFQMILSSMVTVAWLGTLGFRIFHPELKLDFGTLDTVVLLVFGFIFGVGALKKKANGNGTDTKESEVAK